MRNELIKALIIMLVAMPCTMVCHAQENKSELFIKPKLSGYFIGQYQYSSQDEAESNTFNFRLLRLSLSGRIMNDFYWLIQGQANGNTETLGSSPRMVDMYVEWQKYTPFKVKFGQFKRPFTFENPLNPIDIGFLGDAQIIQKLSGFSDRSGERSSNGRDIGAQIQGDLFPNSSGRTLLHYQIGVFNGQGINTKDVDNQKDIIGGLWITPVEGLRIGAFGWTGSYSREGTITDDDGTTRDAMVTVDKRRYAVSIEYAADDWVLRSEYIHHTGYGFKTSENKDGSENDLTLNTAAGDKADGLYAMVSAPLIKEKCHIRLRYDLYRPRAEWGTAKTQYELQANYLFTKHLSLALEYALVNDRSLDKHNYSIVDMQVNVRF